MTPLGYKGYLSSVEFDQEDRIFFGKLLHIRALVSYGPRTPKVWSARSGRPSTTTWSSAEHRGWRPRRR